MKLYYSIMTFALPLIMVVCGAAWKDNGPKKISKLFGYRTPRSMRSMEAWKYAHKYVGRLWYRGGMALAVVSLAFCILLFSLSVQTFANTATIFIFLQMGVFLLSIPATERELKRTFDDEGRPIQR